MTPPPPPLPPGANPQGRSGPLQIALVAAQILQAKLASDQSLMGRVIEQWDEQPLLESLSVAKKLWRLAGEDVPDLIPAYQIFDENEPLSLAKVAGYFDSVCWDGLGTEHLVRKVVEELMRSAADEIQRQNQIFKLATTAHSGVWGDFEDFRSNAETLIYELLKSICPPEFLKVMLPAEHQNASLHLVEKVRAAMLSLESQGIEDNKRMNPRLFAEAFGTEYETYRGATTHDADLSPVDLRNIVWALQDRYECHGDNTDPATRIQKELPKIRQWLLGHKNFREGDATFAESLGIFSELAEMGTTSNRNRKRGKAEELRKGVEAAFLNDLTKLMAGWDMFTIRWLLTFRDTGPITDAIEKLMARHKAVNVTEISGLDDRERYGSLPECARNVLKWLSGEHAKPETLYAHVDMTPGISGHDGALRRRLWELTTCLDELYECLYCPALGDTSGVLDLVKRLRAHLESEARAFQPFSEEIRSTGAKRGNALLDGVSEGAFKLTGKIRPRLVFKYAADVGFKKHEKSLLVFDRAHLKLPPTPTRNPKKKQPKREKGATDAVK